VRSPRLAGIVIVLVWAALSPPSVHAQVKAQLAGDIQPPWNQGIQPIGRDSYWNAVACGKQGGENPPCVFYDSGLCKNDDFTLSMYTPYKMVAHEVWRAVRQHQVAPTPSYAGAQRTRVTLGVMPVKGSKNAITAVVVRRGGRAATPTSNALDGAGGSFTFDFPAFAPTDDIAIDFVGRAGTVSCFVEKAVLSRFR
jgi:hypothetical protein